MVQEGLEGRLGKTNWVETKMGLMLEPNVRRISQVQDLSMDWAQIVPITISQVKHQDARNYLQVLNNTEKPIDTHVYLCSDVRNEVLRDLLSQIPGVAVYNTAGNTIYNPARKPTIVIAHHVCGAVAYSSKYAHDPKAELKAFASMVDGNAVENARKQLEKVDSMFRAGVLYFDHTKGRLIDVPGQNYARNGARHRVFEELAHCLENWYTKSDIQEFADGQNPNLILVSNVHSPPPGFGIFQIDLQVNAFDPIIRDSLNYAMTHALHGNGSFADTKSTILAFREGRDLPLGLYEFLTGNDQAFIRDYTLRGGSVYIARIGDLPSQKSIFQLIAK